MKNCIKLLVALGLFSTTALAQTGGGLKTTIAAFNQMRDRLPIEKVYVHTDKPYYITGDTLHFKAYVLNADYFTPSSRSGLLYVELDNEFGRSVKRIMVPVYAGLAAGDIVFAEDEIAEGGYTLRAYTNWMRNFGESYVFKQNLYVSALENSTLVQSAFKLDSVNGKNKVTGKLKFTAMDNNDLRLKDMQLRVMNGKRTIDRQKVTTGMDGTVSLTFNLADKVAVNNLAIQVAQKGKNVDTTKLIVPVNINRPENTDLQFMPEGGSLLAGVKTRVGFKAIGEDGKAVNVSGKIYNKGQEVATFKSAYKGMGNFEITPLAGAVYTAQAVLPGGVVKTYAMPVVNTAGTALRIAPKGADSLTITISVLGGQPGAVTMYNLISQSREVVCYAQSVGMISGRTFSNTIATSLFPTGITRFTLLNTANQALNERQVFINHYDNLQINLGASKLSYAVRDSVALLLEVKDKDGKPVRGSFSVAVTDDDQVKTDTLGSNMVSNLLFTADLKGDIDEPGYYFTQPAKTTELDNLMLTQGWVGYDVKSVFAAKPDPIKFIAEPEFMVQGKVTGLFGKPIENSNVVLFSKKPTMILDTLTGKDGIFTFKGFMPVDTASFKITSHNKKNKTSYTIDMLNEFKPPVFMLPKAVPTPWYVNSDTLLLNNSNTKLAQQNAESSFRGEGNRLKEVAIRAKKVVKNSKHLAEPTDYDQVIDEAEILKTGKMTLTDLLQTKVKGFQLFGLGSTNPFAKPFPSSFIVDRRLVYFVIDGMPLNKTFDGVDTGPLKDPERFNFLKSNTDYFNAEDIIGIEVMKSVANASRYGGHYVLTAGDAENVRLVDSPPLFTYIEITTRSGSGPYLRHTPGTYLYKPLPITLPKQFYSPKYTVKNRNIGMGTDLRSTIYWQPHIVTDASGKATISFYTADKPANYTILVEGTDLNGNVGHSRSKIAVKPLVN